MHNHNIVGNNGGGGGGGGSTTLAGLTDTLLAALSDNDLLQFDLASAKWENKSLADAGIAGVVHTHVKADISDFTEGDYVHVTGAEAIAGAKTFSDNVIINANLTINGTQTIVNTNIVEIGDNIVLLNSDEAGTPSQDAGIEIERGTETNARLLFEESSDLWKVDPGSGALTALATVADTALSLTIANNLSDVNNAGTSRINLGVAIGSDVQAFDANILTLLNNLVAVTDPGATDDSGSGYSVGSRWINVTLDKEFVCLDATSTAAVWTETTQSGGASIQNKFDAVSDPTVDNDSIEGYEIGSHWTNLVSDVAFICLDATNGAAVWKAVSSGESSSAFGPNLPNGSYDGVSLSANSQDTTAKDLFFKSDGTKVFVIGDQNNSVYQYSCPVPWSLIGASYDSISFSVGSQEVTPSGLSFKDDGTKMYIVGEASTTIYQYNLPTPWVLTGASYDSISLSVGSQDTVPTAIAFKSDGTKVFMLGTTNERVFQYTLPTPWVLTSGSYDSVFLSVNSEDNNARGLTFKSNGTKMYIAGDGNNAVFQYNLPTPWVLTGASYDSISLSVNSQEANVRGVVFGNNDTKMYIIGDISDTIYQYSVETPEINTGRIWEPDGKTIFRRTVVAADTGVGGSETVALDLTIDTLVSLGGYVIRDSDSAKLPLPYSDIAANLNVEARVNSAGTDVIISSGSSQNHNGGFVWLEYTK